MLTATVQMQVLMCSPSLAGGVTGDVLLLHGCTTSNSTLTDVGEAGVVGDDGVLPLVEDHARGRVDALNLIHVCCCSWWCGVTAAAVAPAEVLRGRCTRPSPEWVLPYTISGPEQHQPNSSRPDLCGRSDLAQQQRSGLEDVQIGDCKPMHLVCDAG